MEESTKNQLLQKISKLEQQVEFYKTISDNAFDWEVFRDSNGKILYLSKAFERITGYKRDDIFSGRIKESEIVHPDDWENVYSKIKLSISQQIVTDLEFRIIKPDKSIRYINLSATPVYKDDRFIGIRTSARDVTEQESFVEYAKIQDTLKQSEERFKKYVMSSPTAIFIANKERKYTFVNPAVCKMLGYSVEEMLQLSIPQLIDEDKREFAAESFKELQTIGKTSNVGVQLKRKDGTYVDAILDAVKLSVNEYIAFVKDISRIKEIEKELIEAKRKAEENESKYSSMVNILPDGVIIHRRGIVVYANNTARKIMKASDARDLGGKAAIDFVHPDYKEVVAERIRKSQSDKKYAQLMEEVFIDFEGNPVHVLVAGAPFEYEGEPAMLTVFTDITKLKQAEEELGKAKVEAEASEEKHRLLFENMTQGVVYHDSEGAIIYANNAAAEILGLTLDQLHGKTSFDPRWKAILENEEPISGDMHPAMITLRTYEPVRNFVMGVFVPQLEQYKWININSIPIFKSESKKPHQVIVTFEDITERKAIEKERREKEKLEKEIAIAEESLKFKQRFLANMSHEIRTPLTGVLGMAEILAKTKLETEQSEYLYTIMQSGENLREIINNVLDFSKIEAGKMQLKKKTFKLNNLVSSSENLFKSICKKDIVFESKIDPKLPHFIAADEKRITQVINNLISNAVKFTEKGRIILILDLIAHVDESFQIKVTIRDTGCGISEEKQIKLFEPFTQLDYHDTRQFEGTGLGLSISKELVNLHGGEIGVDSKEGEWSAFWFTFKANEVLVLEEEKLTEDQEAGNRISNLKILLAEDKVVNQKVVKLLLNSLGHKVTIAENGEDALNKYEPNKFDLILMDIQMPVMDGITAVNALREKYKELPPVVGLSANAFEGDKERYMDQGLDEYLTKPFNQKEFTSIIEKLFEETH